MLLNIQQTKSNFHMEWTVTDKNCQMYSFVKAPFVTGKFQADVYFDDKTQYSLYYNPYDTSYGTKMKDKLSFKVLQDGECLGKIVGQTKAVGFLRSYPYYEFSFNHGLYYGYEVGFGSQGLYLCIYKDNQLIAIVDKALRVINYKDSYTAYLLDEQYAKAVIALVVYYDVVAYGDLMQIALLSVKERRVNTVQKELIAKYDPAFIPKIKAMEGIAD